MSKCSRLEKEILALRMELATTRSDRDRLYQKHAPHLKSCGGGDNCVKLQSEMKKMGKKTFNQNRYIAYLEEQIQITRLKYQKQMGDVKSSAGLLEAKLQSVREEMDNITVKAQQVDKLQKSVQILRSKLQRRDAIIARYDAEHTAVAALINSLNLGQQAKPSNLAIALKTDSDAMDAEGCGGDRKDSGNGLQCNSKSSFNFSCLSAALRKKLTQK